MYSQNDEELFILKHFENQGPASLLDIGAYDGKTFSNSLALLEKGWHGVLVEPSPSVFLKLAENVQKHQVDLINAAVHTHTELIKFWDSGGDAISSFDEKHVAKWEAGYNCKFKPYYVKTVTIHEILHIFKRDFSFINLDVESLNHELFKDLMVHLTSGRLAKTSLICVEHDGHHDEMMKSMFTVGFHEIMRNGENIIFARN